MSFLGTQTTLSKALSAIQHEAFSAKPTSLDSWEGKMGREEPCMLPLAEWLHSQGPLRDSPNRGGRHEGTASPTSGSISMPKPPNKAVVKMQ